MQDAQHCNQPAPDIWYIVESTDHEPDFEWVTEQGVFATYSREGLRQYVGANTPIIATAKDVDELVTTILDIGAGGVPLRHTGLTVREVLNGEA